MSCLSIDILIKLYRYIHFIALLHADRNLWNKSFQCVKDKNTSQHLNLK
jgi:hypothetical protein